MMGIIKLLTKRIIYSIIVLLVLSVIIFIMSRVLPGDPARGALGPGISEEVVQQFREEMHLNDTIYIQYYYWLRNAIHGDLGKSFFTRNNVTEDIKKYAPATVELALYGVIFMAIVGIMFGVLSVKHNETWIDNLLRIIAYIGVVTPSFIFAIIFMLIFCYMLNLFPTGGRISPEIIPPPTITGLITIDALISGNFSAFFDALKHLILPSVSLGLAGMSQVSRITRSAMQENASKDYILFMRGAGFPENIIMFRYLLRVSIVPTISIIGLQFGALLGNAFLVESIFYWPGLSRYGLNAILQKDLNAMSAVILFVGIGFIAANIIVDLIINWVDPTIRLRKETLGE